LGLEGSLQGLPITKLALYDPPFIPKDSRPRPGDDFADRLIDLIEADRLGEAVRLYQTEVIGFPPEAVDFFEASDAWSWLTGLAHTLPYDYALLRPDLGVPTERLSGVRVPTLVVVGGNSFDWLQTAAQLVAEAIPAARYVTLEGEDHAVLERPEVLRSILVPFLAP
jgi:pimeloyl-ACP methyl ester carboxylesterase